MRRLIVVLLILIASVWVGMTLMQHPGYMLLSFQPWVVQMPIWFAVLLFLLIFILFYFLITSADRLQFLWFRIKNWFRLHREHKSYSQTQHGLATLIEAKWAKAESLLLKGVNQSFEPLMNYLGAAKAAHELHAYDRRDNYLQKAYQVVPAAELAIGITKAELQLSQGLPESALTILERLRLSYPRHPRVLMLLEKAYIRLADWNKLELLLPSLYKAKVFNATDYERFEKHVYAEKLRAMQDQSRDAIRELWDSMPRKAKKYPEVVLAYVKQLQRFQDDAEMETWIRKILKSHWQGELVQIYGTLSFTQYNRQLVIVGAWLKMYGEHPETLLTLGRLCVHNQLWGKAKDYFERCLALGACREASVAYGQLLEQLGDTEKALQVYRRSLE